MKPKMYSGPSNSMLHDHIIDGFQTTHEGLRKLKEEKLISPDEYTSLLEQNIRRLVQRIHEFRIKEGLMDAGRRVACIYFVSFFIKWSVKPIGLVQPMGCKRQSELALR